MKLFFSFPSLLKFFLSICAESKCEFQAGIEQLGIS